MSAFLPLYWGFLFLSHAYLPTHAIDYTLPSYPDVEIPAVTTAPAGFLPEHSDVPVRFGDQDVPYRVMGVFALPGEEVPVEIVGAADTGYTVEASAGTLREISPNRWSWKAPAEPGTATLLVHRAEATEGTTLNAFVMVPYSDMKRGRVNGYRVGAYPAPRGGKDHESRPRGFVEVTEETAEIQVSPHFTLGQFLCKSGESLPKYVVLQPALLLRLENLLATANEHGIEASTFQVMSGYRTPQYNRAIGNTTSFTRHQYGDAADIFVDDDSDGRMDDLNGDGRLDKQDAMVLHELAEATEGAPEAGGKLGGLSAYSANHSHGPFVHVDTRGYVARW